jgi:hypothetical protein
MSFGPIRAGRGYLQLAHLQSVALAQEDGRLCVTDPALARMRSYEEENITSPSRSIVVGGGERES